MKHDTAKNFLTGPVCVCAGLILAACATTLPPEPDMPPALPEQETLSSPSQLPAPPEASTAVTVPEGVSLSMDGTPVELESLPALDPLDPAQTIHIMADASTPYRNVEWVLERLYDLGYLIVFTSTDTP